MKDLEVRRFAKSGWSRSSTGTRNRDAYELNARKAVLDSMALVLIAGLCPLLWLFPEFRAHAASHPGTGVPLALVGVAGTIVAALSAAGIPKRLARCKEPLHLPDMDSNDPDGAADAIDAMMEQIRTVPQNPRRLASSYEAAVIKMQKLIPDIPLNTLIRYGYYPNRPFENVNGRSIPANHDESSMQAHWNRTCTAIDALRSLLKSDLLVTKRQVHDAVAQVVPPLRAVLRHHGVATHRIEYLPAGTTAPAAIEQAETPATALPAPETTALPEPETATFPPDVFTPIENRLNAAAAMTVSSIRMLDLSFRSAEKDLFSGDDLESGRRLMTQHVPSLLRTYLTAHDGSQGEERDQVRADFAKALVVVRDTLDGMMRRHTQEARRRMDDEARFLQMRHGDGPLSPAPDAAGQ